MELLATAHTIGDILLVLFIGLVVWIGKRAIATLDTHLKECGHKNLTIAVNEEKLTSLMHQMDYTKKQVHWVGDSILVLSTKLNVKLPDRPTSN